MTIKIYLDGANLFDMARLADEVDGFTTNPSLMKSAGITDYASFAREVLAIAGGKPVSFEVLSEDIDVMDRQAKTIAAWGENVFVKIPVVKSDGTPLFQFIYWLAQSDIKINVTAVFTARQASAAALAIEGHDGIVSVFAGRIADLGRSPVEVVRSARARDIDNRDAHEWHDVLWASARQVGSVAEAEHAGADIITLSPALFDKWQAVKNKDVGDYCMETVRQFVADAKGFTL